MSVVGQGLVGCVVIQVVGHMCEVGHAGLEVFDHVERLLERKVSRMLFVTQGVQYERIQPSKLFK